jgi:uncharacterized protein (DUF1778 family)
VPTVSSTKAERIEARITRAQKQMLQRAAEIDGRTLTDFVLNSAQEAARRIIHQHEVLLLRDKDREIFINALLKPPAPNAKLRRAARRHNQRSGL